MARLRDGISDRAQIAPPGVGERRERAVQHEHAHLGTGVAGGEGLPMGPDPTHGVGGARVVLGDDEHPHRKLLYGVPLRCASAARVYGREARNSRASSIATSRSYALAVRRRP